MIEPEPLQLVGQTEVRFQHRTLLYFSGCDFFRLARRTQLAAAAQTVLHKNGLSTSASRMTTGNHELYEKLEADLAIFFGTESAVLLPDGYLAGMAVTQALAGEFTHAFVDELAHGALRDAARMLDCPVKLFKHRDAADLARAIIKCSVDARPLVLTDGMFGHDGSVAPLREHLKILPRNGMILVDDAYGAGVLGKTGQGTLEHAGVNRQQIIQCATLSKAFGAYGGVVLATHALRKKILTRSRIFIGTTPLPLPLAGAALAALKILRAQPRRRKKLFRNVHFVRTHLRAAGWEIAETPGPIIRLPVMSDKHELTLNKRLLAAGIYPPYLRYGNSPHGAFRFVISNAHQPSHLETLCAVLADFKRD